MAAKTSTEHVLPHREEHTAAVKNVKVPSARRAFFLAVETEKLKTANCEELSFRGLSPNDRATFQLLLYLTYCCKGQVLQVTLENPDFCSMSPPVREDFAHGRLFCFVLDMSKDQSCPPSHDAQSQLSSDEYMSGTQLLGLMDVDVNMDVFMEDDSAEAYDCTSSQTTSPEATEVLEEAFNSFMRLQLVRKKAVSLNNAMVAMRDDKGELSSMFDWVDIITDTLNPDKVDRKKVKELQGSLFTPYQSARQAVIPESIRDLSLKVLDSSIGKATDSASQKEGKALFLSLMSKLTSTQWPNHSVIQVGYNMTIGEDVRFVRRLKTFTDDLSRPGSREVDVRGLLVFRYSLETLTDGETPDLFVKSMIHRHMPITKARIEKVLCDIRSKRRTAAPAALLRNGRCYCKKRRDTEDSEACGGACQIAYACFYNFSIQHPFLVSKDEHNYYLAHLYPNLSTLERLSREMKVKYQGRRQFESIADMVFNIMVSHKFSEQDSLYEGLGDALGNTLSISSLSLANGLPEIFESLYLGPGNTDDYPDECSALNPVKVYDHALVRYMFCDSLQVGRLFQISTTFNYIISNTAPRYTIERVMLFNITGPGEGKTYANNVLNYQFKRVRGCIETLTSFTPQAFKYKQKRDARVVMIDDAHITHEKNRKTTDKESNVIPNTFKNLLDTSVLQSDVPTRDANSGKMDTIKYEAVHNCGFVWNTNTMGFVSDAWADRSVIMESEFPDRATRTRSTKQIQDTVEKYKMEHIATVCLYRQNLIQSATMIAESSIMQFGERFDKARDACLAALFASHIVCTGPFSRRVSFCVNQLVFAEAMKLACHFVFDIWIPPWTVIPDAKRHPDLRSFMARMNKNRLKALDKLSFGQICLETNAVYKLCVAACLPDICPRAVDIQGRFACKVLGYILTQIHEQALKTKLDKGQLCISGIDTMTFSEQAIKGGADVVHEMLMLCATCQVPAREDATKSYKLCTYRCAANQKNAHLKRGRSNPNKKVSCVTIPLEAVYDMLAIYAPGSHSGFWDQLSEVMVQAYQNGNFEEVNAFGQCATRSGEEQRPTPRLAFTLDFNQDPVRSEILEATAAIQHLNELTFHKCVLGGETFQCSAPVYYGGVIRRAMSQNAPKESFHKGHLRESRLGPKGTFHGPRLSVYSTEYSGVPVKNMSTFCTTRTMYHQDRIHLTVSRDNCKPVAELEEDWEWKDAADVFNSVHGANVCTVDMLKVDYASTMVAVKGKLITAQPERSRRLQAMLRTLRDSDGHTALAMRKGEVCSGERQGDFTTQGHPLGEGHNTTGGKCNKRSSVQLSGDRADELPRKRKKLNTML